MREQDVARTLLRLYPRKWRERYGEEWLELVDSTGLTWLDVIDVIGAASLQRIRAFVTWRRHETDPEESMRLLTTQTGRDFLVEVPAFTALVVTTVYLTSTLWSLPIPSAAQKVSSWTFWFWLLGSWPLRHAAFAGPGCMRAERVVISFYFFIEALVLTAGVWFIAHQVLTWGQLRPRDGIAILVLIAIPVLPAIRFVTMWMRVWQGMTPTEWRMWRAVLFVWIGWGAVFDDEYQAFWTTVGIAFLFARLPASLTRAFIARQRVLQAALQERMEREFPLKPGGYF